jgi:hypothetical protein
VCVEVADLSQCVFKYLTCRSVCPMSQVPTMSTVRKSSGDIQTEAARQLQGAPDNGDKFTDEVGVTLV